MSYETLIVERKDYVTTVTLNRPDRLNALNDQLVDELNEALAAEDRDEETRVIVITGAGRAFCSGADLRENRTTSGSNELHGFADRIYAAFEIDTPIIAAINGIAVGGGCTMTISCDIRIASDEARFQLPFTRLGMLAELGSTYLLPRLIGMGKASDMVLTSRWVEAEEAGKIGLVDRVVPAAELASVAAAKAAEIAALSPVAVRLNKRGLRQALNTDIASQLRYEALASAYLSHTDDHKEAIAAFREKRQPVFKGR